MKIQVEVDVFDDPEYCQNKNGSCKYLYAEPEDFCLLFHEFLMHMGLYRKCDECKAAYSKAKKN
jgi:hypothetical protein